MSDINNEEPVVEEQESIIATIVTQYKEYDIRNDLTIESDCTSSKDTTTGDTYKLFLVRFPDEQGKIQVCEEGGK